MTRTAYEISRSRQRQLDLAEKASVALTDKKINALTCVSLSIDISHEADVVRVRATHVAWLGEEIPDAVAGIDDEFQEAREGFALRLVSIAGTDGGRYETEWIGTLNARLSVSKNRRRINSQRVITIEEATD